LIQKYSQHAVKQIINDLSFNWRIWSCNKG